MQQRPTLFDLSFALTNISENTIEISEFQFITVFPKDFVDVQISNNLVRMPNEKIMHVIRPIYFDIFPGGMHTDQITLNLPDINRLRGRFYVCQFQILSSLGKREINFTLKDNTHN